jgi:hypothetical protein
MMETGENLEIRPLGRPYRPMAGSLLLWHTVSLSLHNWAGTRVVWESEDPGVEPWVVAIVGKQED